MTRFPRFTLEIFLIVLLFPQVSNAWWTQTHPKISILSDKYYYDVMNSTMFRTNNIHLIDFIASAADPDRHRRLTHFLAESRARNAFQAAINEYRNGRYRLAAQHIGHSFHYIQDFGDPSKSTNSSCKRDVRVMAEDLLSSTMMRKSEAWSWALNAYSSEIGNRNLNQALIFLKNKRRMLSDNFNNLCRDYRGDQRSRVIEIEVLKSLALIVAVQNHLLDIFSKQVTSYTPPSNNKPYLFVLFKINNQKFVYYRDYSDSQIDEKYTKALIHTSGFNIMQQRGAYFSRDHISIIQQYITTQEKARRQHCQYERQGWTPWQSSACY